MLTLFSCPKAFTNQHADIIQRNAIRSWTLLHPQIEIILFGDDPGTADVAKEFGVRHATGVEKNAKGTPLINDIFRRAQDLATHPRVAYANADIILTGDILTAVARIETDRFLMIGRRTDIDIIQALPFGVNWEFELRQRLERDGAPHGYSGIDYFVFPRGLWRDMPTFAVGRPGWDNWLLHEAWIRRHLVIDATTVVTCIHQNHDYSHVTGGKRSVWNGTESDENRRLAGGRGRLFGIRDADYILTWKGLRRAPLSLYRVCTFSFRHFNRTPWARPLLLPGWIAVILVRMIRRSISLVL